MRSHAKDPRSSLGNSPYSQPKLIASQGTAAAGSAGKAKGKVTATIGGVSYLFSFNAGASKKGATGGYIITAPNGDYVSGRVDCYNQTGDAAVFAGPII